jgi:hypothetical protein
MVGLTVGHNTMHPVVHPSTYATCMPYTHKLTSGVQHAKTKRLDHTTLQSHFAISAPGKERRRGEGLTIAWVHSRVLLRMRQTGRPDGFEEGGDTIADARASGARVEMRATATQRNAKAF